MSTFVAVATREIRERWFVLAAAVAFAILPVVIGVLPLGGNTAEKIGMLSGVFSTGLTLGIGAVLGSSLIGRDLTSGKLSFYFARPLGAASIWFGKLAAGLVLIATSLAISFLPVLLVRDSWARTWNVDLRAWSLGLLLGSVVLLLITHVLSTAIRSRSWLIAADFILMKIAFVVFVGAAIWPLLNAQAVAAAGLVGGYSLAAFVLAVIPAGWWQLARGRADRFRSHAALSTALWIAVFAVIAIAFIFSMWVRSGRPSDLTDIGEITRAAESNVIVWGGSASRRLDYRPAFIGDPAAATYRKQPTRGFSKASISADGSTYAFVRVSSPLSVAQSILFENFLSERLRDSTSSPYEVVVRSTRNDVGERSLGAFSGGDVVLSRDGERVAVFDGETVTVQDTSTGKQVFAARIGASKQEWPQLAFVSNELLRVALVERSNGDNRPLRVRLTDLDIVNKKIITRPTVDAWGWVARVSQLSDGRIAVRSFIKGDVQKTAGAMPRLQIVDPVTGRVSSSIAPSAADGRLGFILHLRNGGMAVMENRGKESALRVFDASGVAVREVKFPETPVRLAAELPDGSLVGYCATDRWKVEGRRTYVIHPDGSVSSRKGVLAFPADWTVAESRLPTMSVPCLDDNSQVVLWDVEKDSVTPVAWKKL